MQFSTTLLALSAVAGSVYAHPSPHAHLHHKREVFKKSAVDYNNLDVDWTKVDYSGVDFSGGASGNAANDAPETPEVQAPAKTPETQNKHTSTDGDSSNSGKKGKATGAGSEGFCGGNKKRATLDQIMYKGNTGGEGDSWGCNMKTIDAADVDSYTHTTKFSGTGKKFTCSCFNKVGPTGGLNGFWYSALEFSVSEAGKDDVYMAFDTNTQGACACSPGDSVEKTSDGQQAGTWFEFDWDSAPNGGNSGADASVLVPGKYNMKYHGMKITANGKTCSWVKSDGSNEAAYMPGMEDEDGIGCKGYHEAHLDVLLGDNFST